MITYPIGLFSSKILTPTDGLIAEWLLSNDGIDTSGNSYNFTPNGGVSFVSPEPNAANMGSAKYLEASDQDDFSFTNGSIDLPFALSFKFDGIVAAGSTGIWFLNKRSDSLLTGNAEWQINYVSNKFQIVCIDKTTGGTIAIASPTFSLSAGTEHHIVMQYNGNGSYTGMSIYIDNVLQSSTDVSIGSYTRMRNTSAPITSCKFGWGANGYLDGYIKLMRLYNRTLSTGEITILYNE